MTTIYNTPSFLGLVFGVELEIEAEGLYFREEYYDEDNDCYELSEPNIPRGWVQHTEESICGTELVTAFPTTFDKVCDDICNLFDDIERQGFRPLRTPRGSTHVHVNVSDLSWEQLRSFVMATAWAEPALIELAGKGRKGNLFALPYKTAPLGWENIIQSLRFNQFMYNSDTHYMATNFSPVLRQGSVEFRMGPSARNANDAVTWLGYINEVAKAGRQDKITASAPPVFMQELMKGLPSRVFEAARRQAYAVEAAINRPHVERQQPAPVPSFEDLEENGESAGLTTVSSDAFSFSPLQPNTMDEFITLFQTSILTPEEMNQLYPTDPAVNIYN